MRRLSVAFVLLFCIAARSDEGPPRPIAAWAAGPLEARIAFDRNVPESLAKALIGTRIVFGDDVKAGDRDVPRPPDAPPRGSLRIAAASVEGRTLILATDPHSRDTTYALNLPAPIHQGITYRLRGVEFVWDEVPKGPKPLASGVWPALDSSRLGAEVARVRQGRNVPLRLTLRTLAALPKGKATVGVRSSAPFALDFGSESAKSTPDPKGGQKAEITAEVESDVIDFGATLDLDASTPFTLSASFRTTDKPTERPFAPDQLILPWAPPPSPGPTAAPVPLAMLSGGDSAKGANLFKSEQAKCATCHKFRGEGGEVGPDLSEVFRRDRAWVYRQIGEPSAEIHPDYVPYTVLTKDGRVLAGIVRAEEGDAIRVVNTEGKTFSVKKSEIDELKPSATSIMPVGLPGAIGEEGVRDLIAFLTTPPPAKP